MATTVLSLLLKYLHQSLLYLIFLLQCILLIYRILPPLWFPFLLALGYLPANCWRKFGLVSEPWLGEVMCSSSCFVNLSCAYLGLVLVPPICFCFVGLPFFPSASWNLWRLLLWSLNLKLTSIAGFWMFWLCKCRVSLAWMHFRFLMKYSSYLLILLGLNFNLNL